MPGYKFVRKVKNKFGGGIAFYVNDQLLIRAIKIENPSNIQILTINVNMRKNKVLLVRTYKSSNLSETDFTTNLQTIISNL